MLGWAIAFWFQVVALGDPLPARLAPNPYGSAILLAPNPYAQQYKARPVLALAPMPYPPSASRPRLAATRVRRLPLAPSPYALAVSRYVLAPSPYVDAPTPRLAPMPY